MTHVHKAGRYLREQMSLWLIALLALITAVAFTIPFLLADTADASHGDGTGFDDVTGEVTTVPEDADVFSRLIQFPNNLTGEEVCTQFGTVSDVMVKVDEDVLGTTPIAPGVSVTVELVDSTPDSKTYSVEVEGGVLNDIFLKSDRENNAHYTFHPAVSFASPLDTLTGKGLSHYTVCVDVRTALELEKTAVEDPITIGDPFAYDITVSDVADGIDAINAEIEDELVPDGFDWTITAEDGTACSLSDSDSDGFVDDLLCEFETLADGTSYSLTVETDTNATADHCDQTFTNIAFARADNADEVEAQDSITVQCGGLEVNKTAKHADDSGDTSANLAATFEITDSNGDVHTVNTDAETGEACVDNLPLGDADVVETEGPDDYAADPDTETVTVTDADCDDADVVTASFENIPLTDVEININSQHDGATSTVVECWEGSDTSGDPDFSTTILGDGSLDMDGFEPTDPAVTLTCEITIDP